MRYDPGRDLGWLLLRPWVAIPRLVQVLWSLAGLVLVLLLRGGSSDPAVQKGLARRILNTLTGLGPCFIKLGQALSCLLYTSPSPRDRTRSRMPSSA